MLTITNDWTKQREIITFPSFFSAALELFKEFSFSFKDTMSRLNPRLHDSLSALLDVSTSKRLLLHDLQSYARQSNFNSILLIDQRETISREFSIENSRFSMQVS